MGCRLPLQGVNFRLAKLNDPDNIIDAVEAFFDVELISEDDERFEQHVSPSN